DAAPEPRRELVVIDSRLPDFAQLRSLWELASSDDVIYTILTLDSASDGLQFVTDYLAQSRESFSAIHLATHGFAGGLSLGTTTLTSGSLSQFADELSAWQLNLTADADLFLYGCYIADGSGGELFVDNLSRLLGRDVAASSNATGSSLLGGDWKLEYQVGSVADQTMLYGQLSDSWQHLMLTYTVRDEFTTAAWTNNNGTNNWTAAWSETDAGGAGATTGDVQISGGQLLFKPGSVTNVLSRQANLSGAYAATLTFSYDSTLDNNATATSITLAVSTNGTTWTTLDTFSKTLNTAAGSKSYDLTSYISSTTQLRFSVTTADAGNFYLYVDNFQIAFDINTAPTI
ncbi:MAG: DUF4347 domain-containing protein, partial [Planctomycetota bacterium]